MRSLKARALSYLAKREYSRVELARKLASYAESETQLEALLDELEKSSWLSAERFTDSLLRRQSSRFGNARLIQQLKQHQIDDSLIESAQTRLQEDEYARAQAVWAKKFQHLSIDTIPHPQERAKTRAKQIRFLLMRGFSVDIAIQIVDGTHQHSDAL